MSSPELVFLHIPKTAGTSQRGAFQKHYGVENIFWLGKDCPANIMRYPRDQVGERFVVGGHKLLSFYPRRLDPLYCAILRDPVERAISLFGYYTRPDFARLARDQKTRSDVLEMMRDKGIDPDSMLLSIRHCRSFRKEISNFQCKYLSRHSNTFAAVRKSLRKLDHVIGTMGSHDQFHRELGALLGWPEEPPVEFNRSRDNYLTPFLQDEELVELIGELNKEDQRLVDWVETEHQGLWLNFKDADKRRRRLRKLPRASAKSIPRERSLEEVRDLWPLRGPEKLIWPLSRMIVAQPQRLLYMPTPGAAEPAVNHMMLELSAIPHWKEMQALGIEGVVERFATGLVLDDRSQAEINLIAQSRDYYKFAILYEPLTRLIDAYQLYFVQMRKCLSQWPQLHQLLAETQGLTDPDDELGITFRQFVEACVSNHYNSRVLRPQARFLPWPDSYDRFYRPDQLPVLAKDLTRLRGISVNLPEITVSAIPSAPVAGAGYADTPAGHLPVDAVQWRNKLVDEALLEIIRDFYARDFKLYNRTADNIEEVVAE
tara:strand:+ start:71063 stop:72691 length:1629 start_codon:yes stop_codon:yes gene_type:complete